MKTLTESLFRIVCLSFSALVLVLYLLTTVDIAVERDACSRLSRENGTLREENAKLNLELEERCGLEAIERYARETLGMQPCSASQLVYLEALD